MTTSVGRSEDSSLLHCRGEDVLSSTFVGVRTSSVLHLQE